MLHEMKLGLQRYWRWTTGGSKWRYTPTVMILLFVLLLLVPSSEENDEDVSPSSGPESAESNKLDEALRIEAALYCKDDKCINSYVRRSKESRPFSLCESDDGKTWGMAPLNGDVDSFKCPQSHPQLLAIIGKEKAATPRPAPSTATPRPPTPAPDPPGFAFTNGTKRIGEEVQAGTTYRTRTADSGCYWARLSGFGGTLGEIIANDNTSGPAIVTIGPSDVGFQSNRCGKWTRDLSTITASPTEPFKGNGTYIVNVDIAPGTWQASDAGSCYWSRLRGFGGAGTAEIIANNNGVGIVTISANDRGFKTSRCGTWTKIG